MRPDSLVREPLVAFLLLGALIFGAHAAFERWRGPADVPRVITIPAAEVENLELNWAATWKRPPTADELATLIAARVREEVLAREARAAGLEEGDVIVRRRLAQKYEFLMADLVAPREPTDAELAAALARDPARYAAPPRLDLEQVLFAAARGPRAIDDARAALARLRAGADPARFGDPTLLAARLERATPAEVVAEFGAGFADAVAALAPGAWHGPIASGYGQHLVRVARREAGRAATLAEARAALHDDWLAAERERASAAAYAALLARYEVRIEQPTAPTPASAP